MATTTTTTATTPAPKVLDQTTILSLAFTAGIFVVALILSRKVLDPATPRRLRVLFVWHAFDALIHFVLEGSFLYFCFFSWLPLAGLPNADKFFPDPYNYLGRTDRVHGAQTGGANPFAKLWMVYARADRRSAGVDLTVVSLELLTVLVLAPLSVLVCRDIAKKNPRANIVMISIATAELYGIFMTFCPEWLTGSLHLDTSNFVYLWIFLVGSNLIWVVLPLFGVYVASVDIMDAFRARKAAVGTKKVT